MLTAIAFEGPRNINSVSGGLGTELTLEKVVEVGRPDGNMGREGNEGEPAMRLAEAWIPRPSSSWA